MKSSLTDHLLPTNNHCPDPNVCCILPYSPLNIGAMSVIRSTVMPICHTATTNEGIAILNDNNNKLNTSAATTTGNEIGSPKSVNCKKNSGATLTVGLKEKMGQLQVYPTSPKIGHRQEESESSSKDHSPQIQRRDNAHLDSYKEPDILQIQSRLSPEPNMGNDLKQEISVARPRCGSKVLLSTTRDSTDQGGCAHYIEGDFDSAEEAMEELDFSNKNCKTSTRTPSPHSMGTESYRSASQSSLDSSESHKADLAYHHHTDEDTLPNECSLDYPIRVPIIGFETMEQRARFTVFKLQVVRSPHDSWFVFRRYTDFVLLSDKLKNLSPDFFIPLPPKRWFLDNFDRHFLEERRQGLQEFINRILSSKILCECQPVREFFCLDDPPGPHDSLEESRALCESLEEQTYNLKKELRDKEREIDLLKSELNLYKSQIEDLKRMERLEISGKSSGQDMSSASGPSNGSNQSLDDCPEVDQNNYEGQLANLDSK